VQFSPAPSWKRRRGRGEKFFAPPCGMKQHRFCHAKGIGFAYQKPWVLYIKSPPFYYREGSLLIYRRVPFLYIKGKVSDPQKNRHLSRHVSVSFFKAR
jgi:hypothetical protein